MSRKRRNGPYRRSVATRRRICCLAIARAASASGGGHTSRRPGNWCPRLLRFFCGSVSACSAPMSSSLPRDTPTRMEDARGESRHLPAHLSSLSSPQDMSLESVVRLTLTLALADEVWLLEDLEAVMHFPAQ